VCPWATGGFQISARRFRSLTWSDFTCKPPAMIIDVVVLPSTQVAACCRPFGALPAATFLVQVMFLVLRHKRSAEVGTLGLAPPRMKMLWLIPHAQCPERADGATPCRRLRPRRVSTHPAGPHRGLSMRPTISRAWCCNPPRRRS